MCRSSVPEPPTLLLFTLGLGLVIWLAWGTTANKAGRARATSGFSSAAVADASWSWIDEHGLLLSWDGGSNLMGGVFLGFFADVH